MTDLLLPHTDAGVATRVVVAAGIYLITLVAAGRSPAL